MNPLVVDASWIEPVVVGEDEVYYLGDNRMASFDSRYYGCANRADVKGKFVLFFAPDSFGYNAVNALLDMNQ